MGLRDHWEYQSIDLDGDRELHVNLANGNLTFRERDIDLSAYTGDPDAGIIRTYNSRYLGGSSFGPGDNHDVGARWQMTPNTNNRVNQDIGGMRLIYRDSLAVFPWLDGTAWHSPPFSTESLVRNPDSTWTLTDPDGPTRTFNPAGYPTQLTYQGAPSLDLGYDPQGRMTTVAQAGQTLVSYTYGNLHNGHTPVDTVTAPDGSVHDYGIDWGSFHTYDPPTGPTTTYTYAGVGVLTGIQRGQETVLIGYDADYRVQTVSLDSGSAPPQVWEFTGGSFATQVTEPNGRTAEYEFLRDGTLGLAAERVTFTQPVPLTTLESAWFDQGVVPLGLSHTGSDGGGGHIIDQDADLQAELAAYRQFYDLRRSATDPVDPPITEVVVQAPGDLPPLGGGRAARPPSTGSPKPPQQVGTQRIHDPDFQFQHPDIALAGYEDNGARHLAQIVHWDTEVTYDNDYGWEFNSFVLPFGTRDGCTNQFVDWWIELGGASYAHNFPPTARAYHETGFGLSSLENECGSADFGVGVLYPESLVDGQTYVWEWYEPLDGDNTASSPLELGSQFVRNDCPWPTKSKHCMNLSVKTHSVPSSSYQELEASLLGSLPGCFGGGAALQYLVAAYLQVCDQPAGPPLPVEYGPDGVEVSWTTQHSTSLLPYSLQILRRQPGDDLYTPQDRISTYYGSNYLIDVEPDVEYSLVVYSESTVVGRANFIVDEDPDGETVCYVGDPNPDCDIYIYDV